MSEGHITDDDIERMKRGFELFNARDFDALREFVSPDVVLERVGELEPLRGWDAFRAFQEPDAFEWQTLDVREWTIVDDKAVLHVRIRSKGAASGVELEMDGWMVWTVVDHLVARIASFTSEAEAYAAIGQNPPSDRL